MATPLLSLRLSERGDRDEVFVYTGEGESEQLEAVLDINRPDFDYQVTEYVRCALIEAKEVH